MEDRTELCEVLSWELCQRTDCHWHGSCHREAMMQPEHVQDHENRECKAKSKTITTEELVRSIAEWVKENADKESIFLTANLRWSVDAHDLLYHVCSVSGISEEQIAMWLGEE